VDTQTAAVAKSEAISLVRRTRKHRSAQEKLRIVRETLHPSASVAEVAMRNGVNANQLFTWRRQYLRGQLKGRSAEPLAVPAVLPVRMGEVIEPGSMENAAQPVAPVSRSESIEVEFPSGPRLKVWGSANPQTLQAIIRELARPC
jgi:transposase